ncbi:MAG: c-type cytochrome [Rhodanobacteraceae bacterium]|nr:cytochrome c4 [Pseudomonadota bacterium]
MGIRQWFALAAVLAFASAAFAQLPAAKKPALPEPAISTTAKASASKPAAAPNAAAAIASARATASSATTASASSTTAPASASTAAADAQFAALEKIPAKPGDASAGQGKAAACGACHGMDGNSTDAQYPKLAGQNEQYIVRQLMNFKSGTRSNAIMAGMAAPLAPQDMHDIGAYFATKQSLPGVADQTLAVAGGKLFREGDPSHNIPACMACHGPDGHGNPGAVYAQLAGQHADYVQKTLQAWHDGGGWGGDPHAQIMPAIAKRLTEADIAAVASYVEGLHTAKPGEATAGPEAPAPATASSAATPAAASTTGAPAAASTAAMPAPASTGTTPASAATH